MVATQRFFVFIPKIGEDEPNLTSIFFRGVETTTNQVESLGIVQGRICELPCPEPQVSSVDVNEQNSTSKGKSATRW